MQNFIDAYSWINIRFLLEGLWITIEVSVISIIISFILGTFLGIIRYANIKYLSAIVGFIIDIIRNLPLLLIIFFTYFGLPKPRFFLRSPAIRNEPAPQLFCRDHKKTAERSLHILYTAGLLLHSSRVRPCWSLFFHSLFLLLYRSSFHGSDWKTPVFSDQSQSLLQSCGNSHPLLLYHLPGDSLDSW